MDSEIEFFTGVVSTDRLPPVAATRSSEFVGEFGIANVNDLAVAAQSVAEFGVFAVQKEPRIK